MYVIATLLVCVCKLQTDSKIYTVKWCKDSQDNLEEEQDGRMNYIDIKTYLKTQ